MTSHENNASPQQQDPFDYIKTLIEQASKTFAINPNDAYEKAQEALQLATDASDKTLIGRALNIKGASLAFKAQYTDAVKCLQEAFEIGEQLQDSHIQMTSLYHHGNLYTKIGDLEQALTKYKQAIHFSESISNFHTVTLLNNISVIYSKLNQLEESLKFLYQAQSLCTDQPTDFKVFIHANIAEVHLKLNQIEEAVEQITTAESIIDGDFKNELYKVQFLKAKAKLLAAQHNWDLAMLSLNAAKKCCQDTYDDYRTCSVLREI